MSQSSQTHIFFEFDKIVAQEDQKIIVCFVSIFLAKYLRHSSTYLVATLDLTKLADLSLCKKSLVAEKDKPFMAKQQKSNLILDIS